MCWNTSYLSNFMINPKPISYQWWNEYHLFFFDIPTYFKNSSAFYYRWNRLQFWLPTWLKIDRIFRWKWVSIHLSINILPYLSKAYEYYGIHNVIDWKCMQMFLWIWTPSILIFHPSLNLSKRYEKFQRCYPLFHDFGFLQMSLKLVN